MINKWTEIECIVYNLQPDIIGIHVTEAFSKSTETVHQGNYVLQGFNQFINPQNVDNSDRGIFFTDLIVFLFIRNGLNAFRLLLFVFLGMQSDMWP